MILSKISCIEALVSISLILFISNSSAEVVDRFCTQYSCRYGECEQLFNKYTCHCFPGNQGEKCDRLLTSAENHCLSNPCWNSGTCVNLVDDFRCECPIGYYGKNCKTMNTASCATNPCKNGGICRPLINNGYYCVCVGDFIGLVCETPLPLCSRVDPCFNGAKCENDKCVCKPNFTGTRCETYLFPKLIKNEPKLVKEEKVQKEQKADPASEAALKPTIKKN